MEQNDKKIEKLSLLPKLTSYPILISEDKEAASKSAAVFLGTMDNVVKNVKASYEALKLDEPFDDELWQSLCISSKVVHERYQKKVKAITEMLGADAGVLNPDFINKSNPHILQIETYMQNLPSRLQTFRQNTKGNLQPSDMIYVDTSPTIRPEARADHEECYKVYINSHHEEMILATLNRFADSYNSLLSILVKKGYGHHLGNLNGTFIPHLFNIFEDGISPIPASPSFIANYK